MLIEKIEAFIQEGKPEEDIFQFLIPFFKNSPETGESVAEKLGTLPQEGIPKLLQRMLEGTKEKRVRKIIKRTLYRLKSKGIAVEEISTEKGRSILRPLQPEPPKGFGSGIDFLGQRFLILVIPHTGRGWTAMHGVVSDIQGFIDFSGEEMTRKGVREFLEKIRETSPFPIVEMEPSYVGLLFIQAYQITLDRKRTPPQDYLQSRSEIERVKKEYERPLIYSYFSADEIAREERWLRRTGDLFKHEFLLSWRIEEDEIKPYADAVWEAEESKLVLNQAQKEARFQEVYLKALSELFSGERKSLYQRRLEEMAYVFFKLGKEEEAKISLAGALDLEKPLNLIQPNPFLFQLVTKSIFTLLAEAYEKRVREPSLIMKP